MQIYWLWKNHIFITSIFIVNSISTNSHITNSVWKSKTFICEKLAENWVLHLSHSKCNFHLFSTSINEYCQIVHRSFHSSQSKSVKKYHTQNIDSVVIKNVLCNKWKNLQIVFISRALCTIVLFLKLFLKFFHLLYIMLFISYSGILYTRVP